jgi:hypothetical protein
MDLAFIPFTIPSMEIKIFGTLEWKMGTPMR